MPIFPSYFQPPTFQESNPFLSGMQAGAGIGSEFDRQALMMQQARQAQIQNQYLPQTMQQQLLSSQLANQKAQNVLPYAAPQAAAELQVTQAQPNLLNAQAMNQRAQASMAPSEIEKNRATASDSYADAAKTQWLTAHPLFLSTSPAMQALGGLQYAQGAYPGLMGSGGGMGGAAPSQPQPQQPNQGLTGLGGGITPPASPSSMPMPGGVPGQGNLGSLVMGNVQAELQKPVLENQMTQMKVAGAPYLYATPEQKRYMEAQGTALGFQPDQVVANLVKGQSLEDMADAKGFGRDSSAWPAPSYQPTIATQSRNQLRQAGIAELAPMQQFVTKAMGPYVQSYGSVSPQLLLDQFKSGLGDIKDQNQVDDKISDFIAAQAALPDLQAIRGRTMGLTNIGSEVLNQLNDASMTRMKLLQAKVTPKQWEMGQQKLTNLVDQASQAATKANYQISQAPAPDQMQSGLQNVVPGQTPMAQPGAQTAQPAAPTGQSANPVITVKTSDGNTHQIYQSNLSAAMQRDKNLKVVPNG